MLLPGGKETLPMHVVKVKDSEVRAEDMATRNNII
jgi:hypothetical protein